MGSDWDLIESASLSWPENDLDLNGGDYTRDALSDKTAKRKARPFLIERAKKLTPSGFFLGVVIYAGRRWQDG